MVLVLRVLQLLHLLNFIVLISRHLYNEILRWQLMVRISKFFIGLFFKHTQALAGNIDSSITDIDITSKQNFTQLLAHRQKYEIKIKQVKCTDSKILRLSPPNEKKKKEISDNL